MNCLSNTAVTIRVYCEIFEEIKEAIVLCVPVVAFRGASGARLTGGGGRQPSRITTSTITGGKSITGDLGTFRRALLRILSANSYHSLLTTDGCVLRLLVKKLSRTQMHQVAYFKINMS